MLKTIPIYWGCSNINKFYNPKGIINFQSIDQLIQIVNNLTPDFYNSKKDIIEENYNRVQEYQNYEQRIIDKITEIFKLNNLI
jgi:spore maturation protein CgeB